MLVWIRKFCYLFLGLALSCATYAKDAEEMFAKANDYTVRIDVTISTAFIEDLRGTGHGAGFLVDKKRRWIMTNAHVAARSPSTMEVITKDGSRVSATKVYVDPFIDVAIIELDEDVDSLETAALGCKESPGTGHPVGAYGHPWGLNFTGTQGVISGSTEKWGPTLLQTDTPINGGNSGGPLISMKTGRVVGINTSSIDSEEDQNTNFAVPISQSCRILDLLRDGIDPSPPQAVFDFYDTIGDNDDLTVARALLSAEEIQLKEGDEIVSVEGHAVTKKSEFIHWLRGTLDDVSLTVLRNNETIDLHGRLTPGSKVIDRQGILFSGVLFASGPIRDTDIAGPGINIMVHDIERGSAGDSADIDNYDFVVRIDGTPVQNLEHLRTLLSAKSQSSPDVQIDFLRITGDYESSAWFQSVRRSLKWSEPTEVGVWPNETTAARIESNAE